MSHAAALAYALGSDTPIAERTVLVYDLGGGTFDVSIVRLGRRHFQTIAIEGDVRLGGHDWDARIVDHVAGVVTHETGSDPRADARSQRSYSVRPSGPSGRSASCRAPR